ncbi:uncharacterized protein BDR25DRAFT_303490 [Lindgomyces ingoldianus]|uniref:Uncharacterized protein n=1 Tax=Lindgomyces ingoldianus TaxID=673940 RepID=A0ACB6QXR6_9PLEO|nr:uncharacterized protein BDR25DRAFT_303490 [Lindgomyces ingoldianus]KAF2470870.1 hypothetical protein BDR25DRAFT_303490 [Lindgomyces ingoldianus]
MPLSGFPPHSDPLSCLRRYTVKTGGTLDESCYIVRAISSNSMLLQIAAYCSMLLQIAAYCSMLQAGRA